MLNSAAKARSITSNKVGGALERKLRAELKIVVAYLSICKGELEKAPSSSRISGENTLTQNNLRTKGVKVENRWVHQTASVAVLARNRAAENRSASSAIRIPGIPYKYMMLMYAGALKRTFL